MSLLIKPDIPPKKLKNALTAYAPNILEKEVLLLYDDTVTGSANTGCIVTESAFFAKEIAHPPIMISVCSDTEIYYKKGFMFTKIICNDKFFCSTTQKYDANVIVDLMQSVIDAQDGIFLKSLHEQMPTQCHSCGASVSHNILEEPGIRVPSFCWYYLGQIPENNLCLCEYCGSLLIDFKTILDDEGN